MTGMTGLRRRTSPVGVAAAVAVLALSACTGTDTGAAASGRNFQAGDGSITVLTPDQRKPVGELRGSTLDGQQLDLASYRGKVVVLNVWASWCAPCRAEAPALNAASAELAAKGVEFVGINTRENGNKAAAEAFERTYGITYPSLFDSPDYLLALRGAVAANAIPSTVIVDAQGRIAARVSGATTKTTLVDLVEDVVAGSVSQQ